MLRTSACELIGSIANLNFLKSDEDKAILLIASTLHDNANEIKTRQIVRLGNKKTATTREIQTAIRLWVPGELAKHAQSEAVRIIMTFSSPHTVFKNLKAVYKNDSDDELWSRVFGSRENWIIYRERPKNFLKSF